MVHTKPHQMRKEESKQLRGERDQIKDLRFEKLQVVKFRKARGSSGSKPASAKLSNRVRRFVSSLQFQVTKGALFRGKCKASVWK